MDIGSRDNQEDAVLVNGTVFQKEHLNKTFSTDTLPAVFAVCDGMGGHLFGEKASLFAAQRLTELRKCESAKEAEKILKEIQKASEAELEYDCGTTVAFCVVRKEKIIVGNAGDSRVYGIKGNSIFQLTHDHSLVQELIDAGEISPMEAKRHPLRNLITLGIGPAFCREWEKRKPFCTEILPKEVDKLLLCSDGLSDCLDDDEILQHLDSLLEQAIKKCPHYRDNISIVLVEMNESP